MTAIKIGIQLRSLRLPFRRALETAARLGVRAGEVDARGELRPEQLSGTGLRQLRKLLEDYGLSVCAVGFATRRGYNVEEDLDGRVEATKAALRLAYDLRAGIVINQVGRIPENNEDPSWQLLTDVLRDLGEFGQRVGAKLAAETGSEGPAEMARLLAALPEQSIGVNLDPGNLLVNGYSPREMVEAVGGSIIHVHAKDGVRDLARGRGVEVPLGRGACDFPQLVALLAERAYQGYFTVERSTCDDPLGEVTAAVEYLRNL